MCFPWWGQGRPHPGQLCPSGAPPWHLIQETVPPISKLTLQPTNQPLSTSEAVALQTLHRTGADPARAPQAAPRSASTRSQGRRSLCIRGPHCPSAENFQCCFWSRSTFRPRVGAWDTGLSSGAAAASLPVVLQHHGAMATRGGGPAEGPGRSGQACAGTDFSASNFCERTKGRFY